MSPNLDATQISSTFKNQRMPTIRRWRPLDSLRSLIEARKREIQIKKWRREKKDLLIERYTEGLPTNE